MGEGPTVAWNGIRASPTPPRAYGCGPEAEGRSQPVPPPRRRGLPPGAPGSTGVRGRLGRSPRRLAGSAFTAAVVPCAVARTRATPISTRARGVRLLTPALTPALGMARRFGPVLIGRIGRGGRI
jgi:hypothetical protein